MLYADSSIAGTCCMLRVVLLVPVRLSRLTSHWAISSVSIRGWLAAVRRVSRLKWHIRRKRVVGTFVLRQKVMGHVKTIPFYFCASHRVLQLCRVCWKVLLLFTFRFIRRSVVFYPLTEGRRVATVRGRNVSICAVLINFEKLYLSEVVNCEQCNGAWFCREGMRTWVNMLRIREVG